MPASGEFKLSISKALTDQLAVGLAELTPMALTEANIGLIEKRPGVYQLYLGEDLVYVGSAETRLPTRLKKHWKKIRGRRNIKLEDVSFTCLYVDEDLTVLAPENRLIKVFKTEGIAPWNHNGFGNNDPGRERDSSGFKKDHFDRLYPANMAWVCSAIAPGTYSVEQLLRDLKRALPFNLRYQDKGARSHYAKASVTVPKADMKARELLRLLAAALPDFQMTEFPGYVILYREKRKYPNGRVIS